MLSEALQRNAKHEARLSTSRNIALRYVKRGSEILRFAQNDNETGNVKKKLKVLVLSTAQVLRLLTRISATN